MSEHSITKTQEAILRSAKSHFMEFGYEKASLNQIVKDSGFTKGAFYGYYSSKEELFCALVERTADGIQDILSNVVQKSQNYSESERLYHMTEDFLSSLPELVDYVLAHYDETVLLLSRAGGTRYEHFLENLQTKNESRSRNNIQNSFGETFIHSKTYHIMMTGYFSMIKSVFLSDMSRTEMISAITDIQIMFQVGIMNLFEKKKSEKTIEGRDPR